MKKITICKASKIHKESTYVKSEVQVEMDGEIFRSELVCGHHNIYLRLSDRTGVRTCYKKKSNLPAHKVGKIQYILGLHNLAPTLYSVEKCKIHLLIPRLTRAVLPGKKTVYCIFQEHINITEFYDHWKDKQAEPFIAFRRRVRSVVKKYGLEATDLKKGNILIGEDGLRCIDFDSWKIVDSSLFKK